MEKEVLRLDDFGRGICLVDGKVTFVPKSVEGDIVDLKIISSKKNYNEAILNKVIKQSSKRKAALCPFFSLCGGCDLQNISYEDSIKYKKEKVINYFHKNGIKINPEFVLNENPYKYRNKITLKIIDSKIGYFEANSHNIVKIDKCLIAEDAINETISFIDKMNIKNGEVIIRTNYNKEILIIINTKDEINIDNKYLEENKKTVGIILNDQTIYGENYLLELINGIVFKVSYDSFFQVNRYIASKLFKLIEENISKDDIVLELYSGVGTLSLNAAKKAKQVVGVEIVPNAVLNSIYNAKINKITNAEFVLNDATKAINEINIDYNKVIVDPPRSGLSENIIDELLKNKPSIIIYVSCDMHTLVRDIKLLEEKYEIEKIYTLDMFSYTYHVENMCILKRRDIQINSLISKESMV